MAAKVESARTTKSRHSRRGSFSYSSNAISEINVVPLVDVMLVLLIIFMVTAPMLQQGIDINLPVARRASALKDERLLISIPLSYQADGVLHFGTDPIPFSALEERVRQSMLERTDKQVFVRGDGDLRLQELMDVMDTLKLAGVERVGIVSQPATEIQ